MRIGLVPGSPGRGGTYQYSLSMIDALDPAAAAAEGDELFVLGKPSPQLDFEELARAGWRTATPPLRVPPTPAPVARARTLTRAVGRRALGDGRLRTARRRSQVAGAELDPDVIRPRPDIAAWHARLGIELMLYPVPTPLSFEAGTPYVIAVHDLQHRLQPEFPEVSMPGQEWREYLFRNGIARATLVLADSEVGREDVLEFYGEYGITADRVKVLPFTPPPYLLGDDPVDGAAVEAVRKRYSLPARYLFYPAQFWPHKNHARVVRALAQLVREHGEDAAIVFSGTHTGELRESTHQEALRLARELGVEANVHDLGYIPGEDIAPLYAGAVALVMPTFFGPTNIPVLEAWALGCPVLTSDIRGIREHAGDAAVLVDPRSVDALAGGMLRLWTDEALRQGLAAQGRIRLRDHTPERFASRLAEIVREAKDRVRGDA